MLLLLIGFAFEDLRGIARRRTTSTAEEIEILVDGMNCGGCIKKLERIVSSADGVEEVKAALEPGRVTVRGSIGHAALCDAIVSAGFVPKSD